MKIAFIDCIGLDYDGTTLEKRGIGGSESSIISMARELVRLGFEVTVYNNCDTEDANPGWHDGVLYKDIFDLPNQESVFYDVVISQRTVIPFTPPELFDEVRQPAPRDAYEADWFEMFRDPKTHKVMWMQDTFTWGDNLLEGLVVDGHIDEIFNLSDWHIAYTTNCTHGPRRIFEVLKNKIFHTRNGINRYIDEVDISAKDPNLFVYNASVTKGMVPLVKDIWPKIVQRIPEARLKIVGGYYDFKKEEETPYKQQWRELTELVKTDKTIEFTGIIPQPEVAELLAKASFTIYPGAYPETSGISTLESVNYNTPILGTRFGAMNETGTEMAGYYIDYAIEPNVLAPWINKEFQVNDFVDMVCNAHANKYVHQQKMWACNAVKDISTWDTIALQWAIHFERLDIGTRYFPERTDEERNRANWINYRTHKVFERKFTNQTEWLETPYLPLAEDMQGFETERPTLAIIDIMGMTYDGNTLKKRGLGGSEAAVAQIAVELHKLGFDVTVYNGCDEDDSYPDRYDGVLYKPLSELGTKTYDILISSRAVTPFVPSYWQDFEQTLNRKLRNFGKLDAMQKAAKWKVLWMHDTFIQDGDAHVEDLIYAGHIDEVWTLSDFANNYFQYCSHPRLRIQEVLRNHTWITRNGMRKNEDYEFDPKEKDYKRYIFNANRSKGLKPLLRSVWPKVKEKVPGAKLTVIGGFYNLGKAYKHNDEADDFQKLIEPYLDDDSITFTGIITLDEVYKHLEGAGFLLYPTDEPETFSISTLEALYHNMTLITTNFGALEEVASPNSYQINYSSTPNALKADIDEEAQAEEMANLVLTAGHDVQYNLVYDEIRRKRLDNIKPIAGWDTVALEWKQHLFSKLGLFMSPHEHTEAYNSKLTWNLFFGRKTSTPEQWIAPKPLVEPRIVVITPFYNARDYIDKCILSVAQQTYYNYTHILIDDNSTDDTLEVVYDTINKLPKKLQNRFHVVENDENIGAVGNQVTAIHEYTNLDDIVMLLDGDDWLVNRPDIFDFYANLHEQYDFTYGSCWSLADSIPLHAQEYPNQVKFTGNYKDHKFNWVIPYTHLRTFKSHLIQTVDIRKFQDENENWYRAGGDLSLFYEGLRSCDPARVYAVPDIVCNYNDLNPLNDYKVNAEEQNRTVASLSKPGVKVQDTKPKKILIAIPCKNDIAGQTFKSIYDLEIPDGYVTEFQYFYGYAIAQVRNLIASWVVKGDYDYLLAVDHDMILPKDTLTKMLSHDKDYVSGVYRQRLPEQKIELYDENYTRLPIERIDGNLIPIGASGFGCVLVKKAVFEAFGFPHYEYHENLDQSKIFSEDVDFCKKANNAGFDLFADTSILLGHVGEHVYEIEFPKDPVKERLRELSKLDMLPKDHFEFLKKFEDQPKVAYDIGACVLHWSRKMKEAWPNTKFVAFEAMNECEFLYQEAGMPYATGGLLYHTDGEILPFYQNLYHPGGNSIYKENEVLAQANLFPEESRTFKQTARLDTIVKDYNLPMPDLIKMDVQGAELDVLKGASECLRHAKYLVLELQTTDYNQGSPKKDEVVEYLKRFGFFQVGDKFSGTKHDGDYLFVREGLLLPHLKAESLHQFQ